MGVRDRRHNLERNLGRTRTRLARLRLPLGGLVKKNAEWVRSSFEDVLPDNDVFQD